MTPTVPTTGGTIRQNVISVPVIQLRMKLPPRYLRKRVFERALSFFSFLDFQVEFTLPEIALAQYQRTKILWILMPLLQHDDKIKWKSLSFFIIFNNFTILTLNF